MKKRNIMRAYITDLSTNDCDTHPFIADEDGFSEKQRAVIKNLIKGKSVVRCEIDFKKNVPVLAMENIDTNPTKYISRVKLEIR